MIGFRCHPPGSHATTLLLPASQHSIQVTTSSSFTALWRSPRLAAAMFVTADTLHEMQAQRPEPGGKLLLLFINPQWQSEGQVVSGGCAYCILNISIGVGSEGQCMCTDCSSRATSRSRQEVLTRHCDALPCDGKPLQQPGPSQCPVDFGFGRTRKQAERFVGTCEEVYVLRRYRVFGDDVRLLRSYPSTWQVIPVKRQAKRC